MRTVGGSGTAQIERGRRQAGAHAAAGLTRQVLRPVELAAAAAAAVGTRRRPISRSRWRCSGDCYSGGSGSGGGSDTAAMRQVIVLRRGMRRRQ